MNLRKVGGKVFKLDTFDRAPGRLVFEGDVDVQDNGILSPEYLKRCKTFCNKNQCSIRVETPDNPARPLHFYKQWGCSSKSILFNFQGISIGGGNFMLLDMRSKRNATLRRGRVIGYINADRQGYSLSNTVRQYVLFYQDMPSNLDTVYQACDWVFANVTGWRDVPPLVKKERGAVTRS